jgi:hypothetical protein
MSMPAVCLRSSVVLRREIIVHGKDQRRDAGERHRHELLRRIEGQLALVESDVGGIAGNDRQHRIAVGRSLRDEVRAEDAVRPRAVVDDDRLAEGARHLLRDHARDDVGEAAAGVGHHPADGLVGIALTHGRERGRQR